MNNFNDYKDFTNKIKVKKYIEKNTMIANLTKEEMGQILNVFNNLGDSKKEYLLLKIAEIIIRNRRGEE